MLGAIAGDIVGSRFEGHCAPSPDFALFHPDCRFTDDTVCTVAIADACLERCDFSSTLKAFVRRHPARGYGQKFQDWACSDSRIPYGSWGNGAPMRVAAIGWLALAESDAINLATTSAIVTHNHPAAVEATQAVAVAIFHARNGMAPMTLRRKISGKYGYDLSPERPLFTNGFDVSASGTVPAALRAAIESNSWEHAVRTAVCLGGDTDTLACIAGAIAEEIHGLPRQFADNAQSYLTDDLLAVLRKFEDRVRNIGDQPASA